MAIKYTTPNEDFKKALEGKFQKAASLKFEKNNNTALRGSITPQDKIEDQSPHKIYTMSQNTIKDCNDFSQAKLVGMRVFNPADNESALETVCRDSGNEHKYAGTNKGNHIKATKIALMLAEELEEIKNNEFELAFLRVPSLYINAVWLKSSKDWKKDIFIPINREKKHFGSVKRSISSIANRRSLNLVSPTKVTNKTISLRGRAYYAEDFLKMLKKANEEHLGFDLTPDV
jgi:hypothetical protein